MGRTVARRTGRSVGSVVVAGGYWLCVGLLVVFALLYAFFGVHLVLFGLGEVEETPRAISAVALAYLGLPWSLWMTEVIPLHASEWRWLDGMLPLINLALLVLLSRFLKRAR